MQVSKDFRSLIRRRPRVSTSTSSSPLLKVAPYVAARLLSLSRSSSIGIRHEHDSGVSAIAEKGTKTLSPRWLSDLKERLGKCIMFGLKEDQVRRAGQLLATVSEDWRDLVVGSEGFLTSRDRAGLLSHNVVWGEMDSMGHVNNVAYVRYAESARINWAYNIAVNVDPANKKAWSSLWMPSGYGLILRSIRTDYKFPMTWPDRVSVYHKLRELPTELSTAFHLEVVIMSERHQRPAARCEEEISVYDYQVGKKTVMKPFMLDVFRNLYRDQEEAKTKITTQVLGLLKQVEALERETWNRPDAKEDLGSAA